jgi:hypothetical protein
MQRPQGDTRLLEDPTARRLLASTELARVAYPAKDGTPRVIPMLSTGMAPSSCCRRLPAAIRSPVRRHPAIAVTIDTKGPPPEVVQLRGSAETVDLGGIAPEYALAQRRYYGDEQGRANTEQVAQSGAAMTRIVLRPEWVGMLDFQSRFPGALVASGVAEEDGS